MTLLPLLLFQASEPRLDAKVTLEAPRMTYAELGAWVGKQSGVPVYVTPAIRERKLTALVEDRPLKEIMDRIAETLFLSWDRTKEGYTLRLAEGVASEEARMATVDAQADRQAMLDALERFARLGRQSLDELKQAAESARADQESARKDESEAGKAAFNEAGTRLGQLQSLVYSNYYRAGASLLAQMTPGQRAAILDGRSAYASTQPKVGYLRLSSTAVDGLAENSSNIKSAREVLFRVSYDASSDELRFGLSAVGENGSGASWQALRGTDEASYRAALRDQPFQKRLRAWATTDKAALDTPIKPKKPEPYKIGTTPYRTLADILVDLHERSGLPIVADGFRIAVVAKMPPDGPNLGEWNKALGNWSDSRYRGYRPVLRTSGGWAMFRHPQPWKMFPREAPEAPIRALEAAYARPERASFDDYAAFAWKLTPEQARWLGETSPVMQALPYPFQGNVPFLRLWGSLSSNQRKMAQTAAGLPQSAMTRDQARLYFDCFAGKAGSIFDGPAWMPGAPPLPTDLRLFVNPNGLAMPTDSVDYMANPDRTYGYSSDRDSVPAVSATLGPLGGPGLQSYQVPLRGPTH